MSKRIITLGTWDGKPIEWIVLKEESFGSLVLSKYILFEKRFNIDRGHGNKWIDSELRQYIKENFVLKAFSKEDMKVIVNTLRNHADTIDTKDDVFLLSLSEASELLSDSDRALYNSWWLQDGYSDQSGWTWVVYRDGSIKHNNSSIVNVGVENNGNGVRPAMYIKE